VEGLIGDAFVQPILLPVQLTLVDEGVRNFNDVGNAMRHCVHQCVLLGNQMHLLKNTYMFRVALIQHLFTRVIPIPLPVNHPERLKKCFWAAQPMRYETQADILRQLDLLLRHFGAAALSLKVTRSFDAVRILVLAIMATLADVIVRKTACDIPSLFSLHYSGDSEGPTKPFGFDMGHFAVEGEVLRLVNPELCTALTQVLDYHHQLAKTIPAHHKVFGFERSMQFGEADEALMSQLCYNMAFPQDGIPL
jgi:hypothetical protein